MLTAEAPKILTSDLLLNPVFCVSSCQSLPARLMDSSEIQVEMAEGEQQDPLVILEEGDEVKGVTKRGASSTSVAITQSSSGESAPKKEEEQTGEDRNEEGGEAEMCLEDQSLDKQSTDVEDDLTLGQVTKEDKEEKDQPRESGNLNDGQSRDDSGREGQTNDGMRINKACEGPSGTEDDKGTQSDPEVDAETINSSERHPEGTKSQDDLKKVCGLFLFYFIKAHLAGQTPNKVFHGEFVTYLHVSDKKTVA